MSATEPKMDYAPDLIESVARKIAESHWKDHVADAKVAIRYLLVERVVQVQRDTIRPEVKAPFMADSFHDYEKNNYVSVKFFCDVCKTIIPSVLATALEGAFRTGELTWRLRCHHQEYLHDVSRHELEDIRPGGMLNIMAFQDEMTVPVDQTTKPFLRSDSDKFLRRMNLPEDTIKALCAAENGHRSYVLKSLSPNGTQETAPVDQTAQPVTDVMAEHDRTPDLQAEADRLRRNASHVLVNHDDAVAQAEEEARCLERGIERG